MKHNGKSIFANWQVKIICFVVALFIYIIVAYGIQTRRTITLPLEVVMPEGYKAVSVVPESADLVISGSENVIYLFDAQEFRLKADFSNVSNEGVASVPVTFEADELASHIDLTAMTIYTNPSFIKVYFEKK